MSNSVVAFAQATTFNGTMGGSPFSVTFGNSGANGGQLVGLLNIAQNLVTRLVPFTIGLAVLAFFWYLVLFIWRGGEEPSKRQEGIKGIGYSLLALFVMVSIWGIIGLLSNMLGVGVGGGLPPLEMPRVR